MPSFELVTTVDRFLELEDAWGGLWHQTGAMAFQSHAWLAAWVTQMDRQYSLRIGVIWQDDLRLTAVLPLSVRRFFGLRVLVWAGQAVCDYCDGLGNSGDLRTAWAAIRQARGFDIVRLKNIGPDAKIIALFDPDQLTSNDTCLKLVSSWASGGAWFRNLNKKKRNNFNRGQRRLEEAGPTSMTCLENEADAALVGRLLELKKAWLAATNRQSSYLFDEHHPDRLLKLVQALAKIGRLRIFLIKCGDEIVSASVNIAEGATLGAFFAVYDAKFDRVSPGIMLMTAYTRWAFDNGFREINYLQGGETYKFEFANEHTDLLCYVSAANLRGQTALAAHRLVLAVRARSGKDESRPVTGSAYMTKAGTVRTMTDAEIQGG